MMTVQKVVEPTKLISKLKPRPAVGALVRGTIGVAIIITSLKQSLSLLSVIAYVNQVFIYSEWRTSKSPHFITLRDHTIYMAVNFSEVLTDIGSGLGAFLDSIAAPLAYIVLILGIIGGVVSIFMGIAYVIKKSIK